MQWDKRDLVRSDLLRRAKGREHPDTPVAAGSASVPVCFFPFLHSRSPHSTFPSPRFANTNSFAIQGLHHSADFQSLTPHPPALVLPSRWQGTAEPPMLPGKRRARSGKGVENPALGHDLRWLLSPCICVQVLTHLPFQRSD